VPVWRSHARGVSFRSLEGAIAQLGERLLCKQEVVGSIPSGSTSRNLPESLLWPPLDRSSDPSGSQLRSLARPEVLLFAFVAALALCRCIACECVLSDIVKRDRSERSIMTQVMNGAQFPSIRLDAAGSPVAADRVDCVGRA
jgi:hypothetical protein